MRKYAQRAVERPCCPCEFTRIVADLMKDRGLGVTSMSVGLLIVVLLVEKPRRMALPIIALWGIARLVGW